MNLNLDIRTAVQAAVFLAFLGMAIYFIAGFWTIRSARNMRFFQRKNEIIVRGWRTIIFAFVLGGVGLALRSYAEPVAYRLFPPSPTPLSTPTITLTPTISPTPSITLTPTITNTPSGTETPTVTLTPHIPEAVAIQFESLVTPDPNAVFSELIFTQAIGEGFNPVNPSNVFQNPTGHLYGYFSYDRMANGVQWTALWYHEGKLVYFETKLWDGGSGGSGYTDRADIEVWEPGSYQVEIFVGMDLKVVGNFAIEGVSQTTNTPSSDLPLVPTMTNTRWPTATGFTPSPTITRHPLATTAP